MSDLVRTHGANLAESSGAKLADYGFSDIYLSQTGEVLIRGASDSTAPLSAVPDGMIEDVDALHELVFARGQRENKFHLDFGGVRYRCQKIDSLGGVWFALRKSATRIPRLQELGGLPLPVIRYLASLGSSKGLILISGATGHGKTTTASSLLREYLVAFGNIAVTIEDPPEMPLDGKHGAAGRCFQLRLHDGDWAGYLKDTLRMTPRYIMLGELRSTEDANQALRAAVSGHLVISTIHAGSVQETISSMLKLVRGSESDERARDLLASGLAGVINQTLNRRKTERGYRQQLQITSLFPGEDRGVRALIRDGNVQQLGTAIDQQAARVARNKPPV